RLLVAVEPEEAALRRHVDLLLELAARQGLVAGVEARLEDVGHGDELDGAELAGAQGVLGGAVATTAAADQGQANGLVGGAVPPPPPPPPHAPPAGRLHHVPARHAVLLAAAHGAIPPLGETSERV